MYPSRVQKRSGADLPPNTVDVGPQTEWANPSTTHRIEFPEGTWVVGPAEGPFRRAHSAQEAALFRIDDFRRLYEQGTPRRERAREQLKGKNLACSCSRNVLCHADILIEIANSD